ncbi:MAG TPA: GNAT family N-acetyltransferase, partial [Thermoplasmata archaeon]|nr:GNAT family N-acetyltransferase [Thermoplasmata archaeon]
MRILTLDELPEPSALPLAALKWLDGDAPQDRPFFGRLRRGGFPASPYFGVYAVDGGEVLGRVETLHLDFTGAGGRGKVLGVADVGTRPDAGRRGIARTLIADVHRRARAAGLAWSFLWTRRSWGAHTLYEDLGYRDVYSPPSALRAPGTSRVPAIPRGFRWRKAGPSDAPRLEALLKVSTVDRWGFVPRAAGSFRLRHRMGWRPLESHRILCEGSRPVGFAYVTPQPFSLGVHEIVVRDPAYSPPMLDALQHEAGRRWLAIG